MISWSFNFFLHMVTVGLASMALGGSYILHRQLVAEKSWEKKLFLGGTMRLFSAFGPINIILFTATGIMNMVNRYGAHFPWPVEMWLVFKVILFIILSFNGLYVAPRLGMKRAMLLKSKVEGNGPADADEQLAKQDSTISIFFHAQIVIFVVITFLAVYGSAKHPGLF